LHADGIGGRQRERAEVPNPPHPVRRQEPLPGEQPGPLLEDPEALRRLQAIVNSPSYRSAAEDVEFLEAAETRGPRLELDYLKPELLLRQQGIERTIVVFGGTRIPEPAAAERELEALRALAGEERRDDLERRVKVAERIVARSRYYDVARELGRIVGEAGSRNPAHKLVIMTGGGPGMMEAANRGAFDVGAPSVGLNIRLPREQYPNPYVTPDLGFRMHYFAIRKLHLLLRARALVAFPGGYGTLDELFETLTLVQTRKIMPMPVILVCEDFWRRVVSFDVLADEGVIDREDLDLFWFAETAQAIWEGILRWYEAAGARHEGPLPARRPKKKPGDVPLRRSFRAATRRSDRRDSQGLSDQPV
jgi:uncharacterized protein (TIGR00730 family)